MATTDQGAVFSDMPDQILIHFHGTDAPVCLTGCPELLDYISPTAPYWPYTVTHGPQSGAAPFMIIEGCDTRYRARVGSDGKVRRYKDPIDVMCAIIAELAWSGLRANPDWLCVHGAALEFAGKLVLFPNTRRAGKSTLTACLSAGGNRVYTDDFLPIELDRRGVPMGIASGVGPRLRLPYPDNFSPEMQAFFKANIVVPGHQYGYLRLDRETLASRGERLPFGAIVLLDRKGDAPCELVPATTAEVLRRIIIQNFARAQDANRILKILHFITSNVPLYTLRYSNGEEAATVLKQAFDGGQGLSREDACFEEPAALLDPLRNTPEIARVDLDLPIKRADTTTELVVDDHRFVVDGFGYAIHQMDHISGAVWNILENPIELREVVELFCAAFPDQPREQIEREITRVVKAFSKKRLLRQAVHDAQMPDGIS